MHDIIVVVNASQEIVHDTASCTPLQTHTIYHTHHYTYTSQEIVPLNTSNIVMGADSTSARHWVSFVQQYLSTHPSTRTDHNTLRHPSHTSSSEDGQGGKSGGGGGRARGWVLVATKQMVGVFVAVWVRKGLAGEVQVCVMGWDRMYGMGCMLGVVMLKAWQSTHSTSCMCCTAHYVYTHFHLSHQCCPPPTSPTPTPTPTTPPPYPGCAIPQHTHWCHGTLWQQGRRRHTNAHCRDRCALHCLPPLLR